MHRLPSYLFAVCIVFTTFEMTAQSSIPCYPHYDSEFYSFNKLTSCPPLVTSMPFEVFVGYVGLDSLSKTLVIRDINEFAYSRVTWDDTLKYAAKFILHLTDYNPISLKISASCQSYITNIYDFKRSLALSASKLAPYPRLDAAILESDYVAVVRVVDVVSAIDTSAQISKEYRIAYCSVQDTILGRTFPECEPAAIVHTTNPPPHCLWFDVRKFNVQERLRDGGYPSDSAAVAQTLPVVNSDYLVFLMFKPLCTSSESVYMTLFPIYSAGPTCGILKIVNGHVEDSSNLLGLGINPTVQSAIDLLSGRIADMKNYGG